MIHWGDIACIVFVCVTAIHLGLVKAIEETIHKDLRILKCPKCLSYWSVFAYSIITSREAIASLAVSFLCSYLALWLELFEGFIDSIYMKLYEKIYSDSGNDATPSDTNDGDPDSSVSQLR